MPSDETKIKLLTLEEANTLLPQVRKDLVALRRQRAAIFRTQAQVEIEEMTGESVNGALSPASQAAITKQMDVLHLQTRQFEEKLEQMNQRGAHLKDLDLGLVDFYSRKGREVVFLCWKEGEPEIRYWHTLQGGLRNRKPLDPPGH